MATTKPGAAGLNPRHALSQREIMFCRIYVAQGNAKGGDAYALSFYPEAYKEGEWHVHPKLPTKDRLTKLSSGLLGRRPVAEYVDFLSNTDAGSAARDVLHESALVGDGADAQRAAARILDMEDKLGARDATERYAEMMCAIGAEVVVPIPGGGEAVMPFKEMFPQYSEALPPADVLDKTIRALEGYKAKLEEQGEADNGAEE